MKSILLCASVSLPGLLLADTSADYVNFIRQIQQDTGVEWDMSVSAHGDGIVSPTGVSEVGSFFELWSIHSSNLTEYLLDEQYVTSYTPNATVEILTGDPYEAVPRTRCDQPFQVRITVRGLMDPADPLYVDAPDAAKQVDYSHASFAYAEGTHSLDDVSDPVGTLVEDGYMEENATATVTFKVTNLTGPDLTKVQGEEVFTISALADFGVSGSMLDSERVQIWPMAEGTLSGVDPDELYEEVPPLTVTLKDLYPSSKTYLRIYEGAPTTTPENPEVISDSTIIIEDSIPQDRTLVLSDIDKYFVNEGEHTIELLHETPFGIEIITSSAVRVDRTVEVVGSFFSK